MKGVGFAGRQTRTLMAALRPWGVTTCLFCKMNRIRLNSFGGLEVNTDDNDEEEDVIL